MPALYPNSVAPEDFSIGQVVKKFVGGQVSPYTGIVTQITPTTYKVWVNWAVGGVSQEDPETLIVVPPFQEQSPVKNDSGYNSYEKSLSERYFGTVQPKILMAAKRLAGITKVAEEETKNLGVMATRIASTFATEVVDTLVKEIKACKDKNLTDIQAYQEVYANFSDKCSDGFLRTAVHKCYADDSKEIKDQIASYIKTQEEQVRKYIKNTSLKNELLKRLNKAKANPSDFDSQKFDYAMSDAIKLQKTHQENDVPLTTVESIGTWKLDKTRK